MAGSRNLGGRNGFASHVVGNTASGGVSIADDPTAILAFYGATGAAQTTYTVTNHTDDRALNESADTVAQVANVLGTLINDLKAKGLLG
jgi:hypothetical protein